MKITIKKLTIQNFKGIEHLEVNLDKDAEIRGANGKGKTTVYDAFSWLFSGKDSDGSSDFQLKPVDLDGAEKHNLETIVEATLEADAVFRTVKLKKVFSEKWTKKRGSAQQEFAGHSTDYFIDDVPVRKRDYDDRMNEWVPAWLVSLITNTSRFGEMDWRERRKILLEMCGDLSDQHVVDADETLSGVASILRGTIDDTKSIIAASKKKINEQLTQIPARISELSLEQQAVPPASDEKERWRLQRELDTERTKLDALKNKTAASAKQIEINQLESEILMVKNSAPDISVEKEAARKKLAELEESARKTRKVIFDRESERTSLEKRLNLVNGSLESLRARFQIEKRREASIPGTCPACKQLIPQDQVNAAIAAFLSERKVRLDAINADGVKQSGLKIDIESDISQKVDATRKDEESLIEIMRNLEAAQANLAGIKPMIDEKAIAELRRQKGVLEMDLKAIRNGSAVQEENIIATIEDINAKLKALEAVDTAISLSADREKRIEALKDQEKDLASKFEDLEAQLCLIDRFIVAKVKLSEDRINSHFKMARFKMFDVQVNGLVVECCEMLHKGVPFTGGLNNGARVNTGLDAINTISQHYDVFMPIFIDNAESVTDIIHTESQQIRLIVDAGCEKLTIIS